ncbi:MAG: amidohydrolase, partial [Bacteroidetes bacterium]|nr:amidohydrolase [Bacteroidota bacterium]
MKRPHFLLLLALFGLAHPLLAQKKGTVKPNPLKQVVQQTIDAQFADMTELSDKIWAFEEIAFQESQS